jgi:translation initiation factor 4G
MQTEIVNQVEVPKKRVYKPLSAEAKAKAAEKRATTIAAKKAAGLPASKWSEEAKARAAEKRAANPRKTTRPTLTPEAKASSAAAKAVDAAQAVQTATKTLAQAADDDERIQLAVALSRAVTAAKRAQTRADNLAAIANGTAPAPVKRQRKTKLALPTPHNLEPDFAKVEEPKVDEPKVEEPEVEEELEEQPVVVEKKKRAYKPLTPEAKAAAADKRAKTIAAKKAAAAAAL